MISIEVRFSIYDALFLLLAKSQEDLQMIFFNSTPPQNIVYSYADMVSLNFVLTSAHIFDSNVDHLRDKSTRF